jgi:hypothetical protein
MSEGDDFNHIAAGLGLHPALRELARCWRPFLLGFAFGMPAGMLLLYLLSLVD